MTNLSKFLLIFSFLTLPYSAQAFEGKLSGCMCVSDNGLILDALIMKNKNIWIVSRCIHAEESDWCISPRYSFSREGDEIVVETASVVGAKDTWEINLKTGRTTQRIDDEYGKAIGGDLCDCKFSEDMDGFIEGLLTELN